MCFIIADQIDAAIFQFPAVPVLHVVSSTELHVQWRHPKPASANYPEIHEHKYLIFLLLWRSSSKPAWRRVTMTSNHFASVDGRHNDHPGLQFYLLAISSLGTVAHSEPLYPPGKGSFKL